MRAMRLHRVGSTLRLDELREPDPGPGELLLEVEACAVCRTDLHIVDGEVAAPRLPLTLGHQIVGRAADGRRLGVPWLAWTCGECRYCLSGRENLCERARFTGLDRDGGFATRAVACEAFCLPLGEDGEASQLAPLLCGGLIGYRALRRAGDAERLGLYGFGSAAHQICQAAVFQGRRVFAFTSPGDRETQEFARSLGAEWAGGSDVAPPEELDAAIIFAPVGPLVVSALRAVAAGGAVVCAGIHMSDIPSFPYELLWRERSISSIANLTREDGREFLRVAAEVPVRTAVTTYPLERANEALADLRAGAFEGSAVVVPR
jgi:propanol-preferring alcohol dehydrogenase